MRLVCVSDTHGFHRRLTVPDGDVFICAGDFSMRAQMKHVIEFVDWVKRLPHPVKIVVAGNHDCYCEGNESFVKEEFFPVVFLNHESFTVNGVTFFGSPYSSAIHDPSDWCYDYSRWGERGERLWNSIRKNLISPDVLITHGPPYGIGDMVLFAHEGEDPHVGDHTLLKVVEDLQPKVHIYGHIHEGYGQYQHSTCSTKFYNVSTCNVDYRPVNPVTIIDLD